MQWLWCWRCKSEMPMLDEVEFVVVMEVFRDSIRAVQALREHTGVALDHPSVDACFKPVRNSYERITGMKDCHHNAIWHHRHSLYGPPCKRCERPLRTPAAKLCGSCMSPVH